MREVFLFRDRRVREKYIRICMTTEQVKVGGAATRGSFISSSIAELKKVTFPTRQETMQATLVTLFIVFFMSICLFVLDQIFAMIMSALLK